MSLALFYKADQSGWVGRHDLCLCSFKLMIVSHSLTQTKPVSLTVSTTNNTFPLISLFKADEGQTLSQGHSGGSILKFNRSHTQIQSELRGGIKQPRKIIKGRLYLMSQE